MTECRASSSENSGSSSSVGARRAWIAFLKPASSKADCHSSTPAMKYGTHSGGVAGSMYQIQGFFGSTSSPRAQAAGSDGSIR